MSVSDNQESSGFGSLWSRLGAAGRWGLGIGGLLCVAIAIVVLWWAMRTDYQVLFSNLEESDAGVVVAELKEQKIPYRLDDVKGTISVPAGQVYETRLSLMSGDMPLTGGVGFEIFDRQGLGATEQSQRVAYQRALQGELARTIGALEHVRQARVLLVLSESTLFKRDQQKPRAAVSLVLEAGTQLADEQVAGVQRLVAAAIAGMDVDQVVVTDQRGVTLSAPDASSMDAAATGTRLKLKAELEDYFARKIYAMLERVVGPGKAIVTIDTTLNFDKITRSLQTLVPMVSGDSKDGGGVLKRRETRSRAATTPESLELQGGNDTTSMDMEYEFGKSIEQVAAAPGALTRLSVSVIVPGAMTVERESRLQQLIRAAVGIDASRGDTVVVDSLARVAGELASADSTVATAQGVESEYTPPTVVNEGSRARGLTSAVTTSWGLVGTIAVGFALLMVLAAVSLRQFRGGVQLSVEAREALLADILATLDTPRPETAKRI